MSNYNSSYKRKCIFVLMIAVSILGVITFQQAIKSKNMQDVLEKNMPAFANKTYQTVNVVKVYNLPTEYIEDENIYEGENESEEGRPGLEKITYILTYDSGEEIVRKEVDRCVAKEAVAPKVHIGTKVKPEFIYPVSNYILSSEFGPRWGTNHNGIDLAVPTGTEVLASADGIVIQSGWNGGYGISVYIDHGNGVITRYGHMSENLCEVGQAVKQGDIIGLSGSTGDSTGPHVHFEIRIEDIPVDPLQRL